MLATAWALRARWGDLRWTLPEDVDPAKTFLRGAVKATTRRTTQGLNIDLPEKTIDMTEVLKLADKVPGAEETLSWATDPGAVRVHGELPMPGKCSKVSGDIWEKCEANGVCARKRRDEEAACVLTAFVIQKPSKPDEGRIIIDARPLNDATGEPPRMCLAGPGEITKGILDGEKRVAAKADFRGIFHQIPLHPGLHKYFVLREPKEPWRRWTRLPMGWSAAPPIAQKTAECIVGEASDDGFGWAHIDDVLLLGRDEDNLNERCTGFLERVERVGAELHAKKTDWGPLEEVEYVGLIWDLKSGDYRLPREWRLKAAEGVDILREHPTTTVRRAWQVVGKVMWVAYALRVRLCEYGDLMGWISETAKDVMELGWEETVTMPERVRDDLRRRGAGSLRRSPLHGRLERRKRD
eukprot:Sspe_Gene.26605::Locus_11138_Transcript_1_1_Confidence_1.000_Length_1636::g.26605::m.26605